MLANYDIHEMVAQSPESVVFAGEEKQGGAPMAMRRYLVRRDGQRQAEDAAAFEAEAARVYAIEEAHVVGILHAGFDAQDHHPFFVTRRISGESLPQMLNGALLAESDARQIVSDALDGLKFLHDRGLVHGGLRPDRLSWSRDRGACLMDAGVEPALIQLGDYAAAGDPSTLAPELKQKPARSVAGDFYALGACVFELLSGAPLPADGRPRPSVGDGPLARWDPWLDAMCAEDPGARPASTAEAGALLDAALAAKPARLLTTTRATATPALQLAPAAPPRPTAAPLLVRAKAPEPVILSAAIPESIGPEAPAPTVPTAAGWTPAVSITGQTPAAPLSAKPRLITPRRAIAAILGLGAAAGAFFLVLQTHPDPSGKMPATAAAAPQAPNAPPKAAAYPPASAAEKAKAPSYFVKDKKDIDKLRTRPDGEPANLHGEVSKVIISASSTYLDVVFRGTTARAFVKIDPSIPDQVTLRQLQERFIKKRVKIYGVVEHRAAEEGNPNIGVRFLHAADITIEP